MHTLTGLPHNYKTFPLADKHTLIFCPTESQCKMQLPKWLYYNS